MVDAENRPDHAIPRGDANPNEQPLFDLRLDWGRLAAGGADVHVIPGDHETLLREPNVRKAGKLPGNYLEAAGHVLMSALCLAVF